MFEDIASLDIFFLKLQSATKTKLYKGECTAKAKVKVPKKKLKAYKSILKTAGINGKKQKITK